MEPSKINLIAGSLDWLPTGGALQFSRGGYLVQLGSGRLIGAERLLPDLQRSLVEWLRFVVLEPGCTTLLVARARTQRESLIIPLVL